MIVILHFIVVCYRVHGSLLSGSLSFVLWDLKDWLRNSIHTALAVCCRFGPSLIQQHRFSAAGILQPQLVAQKVVLPVLFPILLHLLRWNQPRLFTLLAADSDFLLNFLSWNSASLLAEFIQLLFDPLRWVNWARLFADWLGLWIRIIYEGW